MREITSNVQLGVRRTNSLIRALQLGVNDCGGYTEHLLKSIAKSVGLQLPRVGTGRGSYSNYIYDYEQEGIDCSDLFAFIAAQNRMEIARMPESRQRQYSIGNYGYEPKRTTYLGQSYRYIRASNSTISSHYKERHAMLKRLIKLDDRTRDLLESCVKTVENGTTIDVVVTEADFDNGGSQV